MTSPGPFRAQFDAAIAAASLQVTKESVLSFRDAIYREVDRLDAELVAHAEHATNLPPLGDDPVSRDAARAFSGRIRYLLTQCQQYNNDLRAAAAALDHTARSYGLTEAEIADEFHAAASVVVPQLEDTYRGRVALPAPAAPPGAGPRTRILAPGTITRALHPDPSGAL